MQLTPTIGCAQCRTARAATLFRILACFALLRLATGHGPAPSSAPPVTDDVSTLAQMRRPSMHTSLPPIYGVHTQSIQDMILQYVDETLNRRTFELLAGLTLIEKNRTQSDAAVAQQSARQASPAAAPFDVQLLDRLTRFAETHVINLSVPRAVQATAKTFFFKSLKKVMWPLFIGLQVVKTMLLAMFLPSIIGSVGKILGKGLSSVSGFGGAPAETIDNLEFKDNYNANIDAEDPNYSYPSPQPGVGDSVANPSYTQHMYEAANDAHNTLSRFGIGGNRVTYVNNGGGDYAPQMQQTNGGGGGASAFGKKTDFKDFHDIPASSMLLTNYDPFYSPLLSRLDAVFQQMGLAAGNERCREKLVCLMYSSPAKYAPYSNLVSAQLSRELNELKKPTTDNPDILRFFKYMRAAKDGQDQTNCAQAFSECTSLTDTDSPAMLTTYNDINKLVQARKL